LPQQIKNIIGRLPRWALYTASSMLSGALDYSIYFFLSRVALTKLAMKVSSSVIMHLAFTTGRLSGGLCNFFINERFVFRTGSTGRGVRLIRYLLMLVVIAFLGNWIIARLYTVREMDDLLAKIITDLTMFVLGYCIQRFFVFRKRSL
jgi:putative flippase GtrA